MKKLILFDMDATLLKTDLRMRTDAFDKTTLDGRRFLHLMKKYGRTWDTYQKMVDCIRNDWYFKHKADDFLEEVELVFADNYDDVELRKGTSSFLQYIKDKGHKIALCTNSAIAGVERVFARFGLDIYFDFVITSQQVTNGKPDPEMYLKASRFADIPPSDCIVFEDSYDGMQASVRANMPFVRVYNALDKQDDIRDLQFMATTVIKDFDDPILKELL